MAGTAARRLAAVISLAALIAGCGSSQTPSAGPSGAASATPTSAASSATDAPTEEPSASAATGAPAIERAVYFLDADSTGWKPNAGTRIVLMFEPEGRAVLYATSTSDKLGHHGTWRYEGGQLSVKFTAEDFKPDATFALDPAADTATMPFLVSETGPGSSTWKRGELSLVTRVNVVFHAYAADTDTAVTPDQAIDEIVAVGQSMVGSADSTDELPIALAEPPLLALARDGGPDWIGRSDVKPPTIKSVSKLDNGLRVEYEDAPAVDVALFDMLDEPTNVTALTAGPIASDPRVRLDPEPSGHSDDPTNRKALFIAPFSLRRYPGGLWTRFAPDGWVKWVGGNPGYVAANSAYKWYEGAAARLSRHGYDVQILADEDATLPEVVKALGGPSGTAPGVVMVQTHGGSSGNLTLGVDLGPASDMATVNKNFAAAVDEMVKIAPDFATFEGGTAAAPKTVDMTAISYANDEFHGDFFLAVTPAFWRWLASRGVKFDKSLVFIAACSTDSSADLREAIRAKAYFAWSMPVYASLNRAVASYIADSMTRPTHTAEEAYYNVVRIVSTGQRIYDEDQDFKGAFAKDFPKGTGFMVFFRGYGWNGSTLVPYMTNGWFDWSMNQGNVWWLVFAGRWDKKAGDGAAALVDCQKTYWEKEERAGLRDAFCNSAAPGGLPKLDEVAYAGYVITGKEVLPFTGTYVPRMTLVDGEQ